MIRFGSHKRQKAIAIFPKVPQYGYMTTGFEEKNRSHIQEFAKSRIEDEVSAALQKVLELTSMSEQELSADSLMKQAELYAAIMQFGVNIYRKGAKDGVIPLAHVI